MRDNGGGRTLDGDHHDQRTLVRVEVAPEDAAEVGAGDQGDSVEALGLRHGPDRGKSVV
jgi:hypothetical protein